MTRNPNPQAPRPEPAAPRAGPTARKGDGYDIVVIGAGAGGLSVAAGAASLGARVALVEKRDALGGDCLFHGCVPSKAFIEASRLAHALPSPTAEGASPRTSGLTFSSLSTAPGSRVWGWACSSAATS